jgi:hypothetical protein
VPPAPLVGLDCPVTPDGALATVVGTVEEWLALEDAG